MIRAAAIAIVLAACGDGGASGDAAEPLDAREPDAPIAFPRQGGLVSVGFNASSGATNLGAGFWKTSAGGDGCMRRAEGPCTITTCADSATSGVYAVSAGEITATGKTAMAIQPAADGTYPFGSDATMPFSVGSTVTVTAAGADVAAFTQDRTMPSPVAVTEPATMTGVIVDRALPFTFRWSVGTGNVYLYLDSGSGGGSIYPITVGGTIRCVVPSADGELTIATSALADLPPGSGTLAVAGIDEEWVDVGGFELQVRAIAHDFAGSTTVQ